MKLSIIIVNWNTKNLLSDCISSVFEHAMEVDFELIVVDNASSDGSQNMINCQFPEVILISNSNNPGFAKANNQALRICSGEYVLLLNPDTIVKSGAIEKLVNFLDGSPEAGAAGADCIIQMDHCSDLHIPNRHCFVNSGDYSTLIV